MSGGPEGRVVLPVSHGQERLWLLEQLAPASPAYILSGALRLEGALDVAALRTALEEIVARHEVLRTTFAVADGRPVQVVSDEAALPFEEVDLGGLSPEERDAALRREAREAAERPFALERGPLLRARVLKLAPREHVLLLALHHIVADAWSMGVFIRELAALYPAFREGRPSPLPELPVQYGDFAAWQRELLQGATVEAQIAYWKARLAGAPPVLDLPADRPRPPVPGSSGGTHVFALDPSVREGVRELARRAGATPFMVLLAAFDALLHRYTGQDDIVVGSPVANRSRVELEGLIGFFANTLALRADLSGDPSFLELLGRTRAVCLGAYAHQDLPFERLVDELHPVRRLSHSPVFQVAFALQNVPLEPLALPGLRISALPREVGVARFDLEVQLFESAQGIAGLVYYSRDLFEEATIDRLAGHYARILEGAVTRPDRRISDLPLLSAEESRRVTVDFASTSVDHGAEAFVHEQVAANARRRPEATAVASGDERLSYADLDRRADALARRLRALGVGPEVLVGLCAQRSPALVVGALAVLKAGGAYVPLDPVNPRERLLAMVGAARLGLLLTTADLAGRLDDLGATLVRVDDPRVNDAAAAALEAPALVPDNLAYAIFTSGSTGAPKAVGLTHRGLLNLALWHRRVYGVGDEDRATLLAGVGFDASVWEVWPYLTAGASLRVTPDERRSEPGPLLSWMAAEGITLSFLPTPLAEAVLGEEPPPGLALKALLTGGDTLHRPPRAGLPFRLFNHYGPTEDTVVATWTEVPAGGDAAPPIGGPIDNNRVYVLDPHLHPVPVGVPGELCIGGPGLARGYLGRPDLTAASFVPDAVSGAPGARLYRSGDRVRWRADGRIEFLGRVDGQVKLRGVRIEPGEIEAALLGHDEVEETLVRLREAPFGGRHLVAYVVPRSGRPDAAARRELARRLRSHVAERLPDDRVPTAYVFLDRLPLTPNGKVDQDALGALDVEWPSGDQGAEPRTPVEDALVHIWAEVLGVPAVGIHDNFFELGGHSLLATQVVSRVRPLFGIDLPLRELFEAPTPAGLAERVEARRRPGRAVTVPPIVALERGGELPLSFAQQRLWFLDQMGASAAYNVPGAIRLRGALDPAALRGSIDDVVARHEVLRTCFPAEDGRPRQVVIERLEVPFASVDISRLEGNEREAEARRLAIEEAERAFDLTRAPLVRATLLRLGADDHVLLLTFHHVVFDGWSLGVFFRELAAHYRARHTGSRAALTELPVQYADFAHWQRGWLTGEALETQLAYWRDRLADLPRLDLPADRARPDVLSYRGGRHVFSLGPEAAARLAALGRDAAATSFMVLLAAFKVLLLRYAGQSDVAVGSAIANRNRRELEGLIGFFVNTLVLRTDLSGQPSFRELVGRVRAVALGAYDHQDVPFEKLVEELHPDRDLAHNPLFQVIFAVQNAPRQPLDLPGLEATAFDRGTASTRFDLEVHVWESGEGLTGVVAYNADLFEAATIARMFDHYRMLLAAALEDPDRRISELPLMAPGQRAASLALGRGRKTGYPRESTVPAAFERQVLRTPHAVAVASGEDRLDYAGLDRRANRLAHALLRRGVARGARVGVCLEGSAQAIVALLGILKAGGAYVPLDAAYPRDRLELLARDARVAALVTDERLGRRLPDLGVPVLDLSTAAGALAAEPETTPAVALSPDDLAYVTYTSGSTGLPKGAEVTHRGVLRLVLAADYARLGPQEVLLQLAPITFDASTLEIWGALLVGGRCVVYPERLPSPRELGELLRREGVTTLWLTASLYNAVIDEAPEALRPVRQLLIGGEALSIPHVRRGLDVLPDTRIINGYGPTENTTFTCCHEIPADLPPRALSVPIGRPIAETDVYVLDERMEPVPLGVPGELYVGGDGLARGYLDRPGLTAERFVPDPFAAEPGARLYRTGDRVRWLGDGTLEFLGRRDGQVKLRGFRVELGEVEAVLSRHPLVRSSVVLVHEGASARDKRLVAFVVAGGASDGPGDGASGRDRRVAQWRQVYDSVIYDHIDAQSAAEPAFNLAGWNSSYTGQPIPSAEMREQVEQAVDRVLAGRPQRVLEIGCGTGLLLFRIAPRCRRYVGTDFSPTALDYLRQQLASEPDRWAMVELQQRRAEDFEGIEAGSFDAVVLNSVVQYFPDAEYLRVVLEGALRALAPGGRLFVGDVRHRGLLETFAASVQLFQAPPSLSKAALRERVADHLAQEQELVVAPSFFDALARRSPAVTRVHVAPKRGRGRNELTKYRYDVLLEVGAPSHEEPLRWLDWEENALDLEQLESLLSRGVPRALGIRRVPNARTRADVLAARWLTRDGDDPRDGDDGAGVDPEDLWALERTLPFAVDLSWAAGHGEARFDVLFRRRDAESLPLPAFPAAEAAALPLSHSTNAPLQATQVRGLVPQLRRFLQERLPEYMVPSSLVVLDALPLSPNGKVDHRALLARELSRPEADEAFEGPRTPAEEELARIWAQVLGLPRVGIHDNFFELGGDSILSIQIVARANQAGLRLTPKHVFQHQTVAELARVAGTAAPVRAEQGLVTGTVPLTPIQRWFFEQDLEQAHHFNQAVLLEPKVDLDPDLLKRGARALEEHHDALRLRFIPAHGRAIPSPGTGEHPLSFRERGRDEGVRRGEAERAELAAPADGAFVVLDLTATPAGAERDAIEAAAAEMQRSLDLARGPVWRLALMELGPGRGRRLLIVVHHLAVDGVSWRVLLEDLERACAQLRRGEPVRLPAKTTSFRHWAERLVEYAGSAALAEELELWRPRANGAAPGLPLSAAAADDDTVESAGTVTVALTADDTRALLQDVPAAYRTRVDEVLLTALARSLARWTGRRRVRLDLEGHGREDLFEDVDVSRTVGWFTSLYPVELVVPEEADPGAALKAVKEQLRAVPHRGIGYGLLRYLRGESDPALAGHPAEVSFNYLGQLDATASALELFAPAAESPGPTRSPKAKRQHRLEVNARVAGGCLVASWIHGRRALTQAVIESVAGDFVGELRAIIEHCRSAGAGGATPSDFPLARVDQPTLDRLLAGRDVEDVYPLTPLQEGLLFHSLLEPDSGVYVEQLAIDVRGRIDRSALARAWERVLERHPVLRTTFAWTGLGRPLQIVERHVSLPWEEHDWRGLPEAEREQRLAALEGDGRGFDLSRAPLTRLTLVQCEDERQRLVWSFHHGVLDGWSLPIVFRELAAGYAAIVDGREPHVEPARPFREYVAWLERQDLGRAEAHWRETLAGFGTPTPLPFDRDPGGRHEAGSARGERSFELPAAATAALKAMGREHQVTLGTFVQAAWALVLARGSGGDDVVLGVNVSGRPPALPGVESMVGLFVNTLPTRVRVSEDEPVVSWLRRLQAQQVEQRHYEFSALAKVQEWSAVPAGRPLFDSILAFENYPVDPAARALGTSVALRYRGKTNYPLALTAAASGPQLSMRMVYDRRRFDDEAVERLQRCVGTVLEAFAAEPQQRLSAVPLLAEPERRRILVEWNETARAHPAAAALDRMFAAQAERTPDAVAVVFGDEALTYRELDRRADRLAGVLRARGVGPDVLVGVLMERSLDLVVALLATLKAGGAYVPLDPAYPAERLRMMLEDAGAAVVLTTAALRPRVPAAAAPLCVDAAEDTTVPSRSTPSPPTGYSDAVAPTGLQRRGARVPRPEGGASASADLERLAYVIYTSGSTGRPKGVMVPHRAIANHMAWMLAAFPLGPDDAVLQKTPLSFDASVWEFWAPLLSGARLVLASPDAHRDPAGLVETIVRQHVTVLQLVPTQLRLLLDQPRFGECRSLKRVFCGGEALPAELVSRFEERLPAGLHNLYGPTEAAIDATVWTHDRGSRSATVPIGRPVDNMRAYVLDARLRPVPVGIAGELYLGGAGLARGYRDRPDLTAAAFVPDPFASAPGSRLYRTGDLASYRADGQLEFLGRADHQVKVRGLRIEPGEIEAALAACPGVREAVVVAREAAPGDVRLVAYLTARGEAPPIDDVRRSLRERLPEHMVPGAFLVLEALPLTPSGKVDRRALPAPGQTASAVRGAEPTTAAERRIAAVWSELLRVERVGAEDNFFDLGGHSLLLLQLHGRLREEFPAAELSVVDLFRHPTVRALAERLAAGHDEHSPAARASERARRRREAQQDGIAIVGMAGRFPGARSVEELWRNLRSGVESVSFFSDEELLAAGVARELLRDPRTVKARGVLEGVELFDAGFFGFNPREAEVLDPQQRVFLETAWEALERAGYDPARHEGLVGVYAGVGMNTYWLNLSANPELVGSLGGFAAVIGSDKDFLPTRVSYKLDLRGPSVAVQTACSTSLVAVHLACQALLGHDCDMALAGGVSFALPQRAPYRYQEEGILSPDGHCRAFDARAQGTVAGGGVGIVVLKRLADALRDGDAIDAVIRGSAINNDGALKVGYTAPGVEGQAQVIALAQAAAGVRADSIGYVEAHGTGTALGDPIEIEALTQVFRAQTAETGFCAIGSLKTNVGHLDTAAGVAGLIKTVLALKHGELPPSLHFETPNPKIDFVSSPFYVNDRLRPWTANGAPRRAGVSSFGIGGTNAHVVLEEAPAVPPAGPACDWQLLVVSAKTSAALEEATARLTAHLRDGDVDLADAAYTLQVGRRPFAHRRIAVCRNDRADAARTLEGRDPRSVFDGAAAGPPEGGVAFLFPGQGSQYVGMGAELYRHEPVFRDEVDRCAELLRRELGLDLRDVLYPAVASPAAEARLTDTALAQPALFVVEWALGRLWMSWGVTPSAMIGHSLGEYTAACVSGVFGLEDALTLVAARGRLMGAQPEGAMLAVASSESEVRRSLGTRLSLAAVNAPDQCVVSGAVADVDELAVRLRSSGTECRRLATSHAFHSAMMDPALDAFRSRVRGVRLETPRVPFVSNLTGTWIRANEATDPEYWVRHLRETVRFDQGAGALLGGPRRVLLEVGPGQALSGLVRRRPDGGGRAIASMRGAEEPVSDQARAFTALGRLWLSGVDADWAALHSQGRRRRVPLPAYPFQRQRYWVDARPRALAAAPAVPAAAKRDIAEWFSLPSWKRSAPAIAAPANGGGSSATWLIFADSCGLGTELARRLEERGHRVTSVTPGAAFSRLGEASYTIDPARGEDYERLVADILAEGRPPARVAHLWSVTRRDDAASPLDTTLALGFHSLLHLARALGALCPGQDVDLSVVTNGMQEVSGEGLPSPEKATVLGPCKVIPREYPRIRCRSIDLASPAAAFSPQELDRVAAELVGGHEPVVALRGIDRWVPAFEPLRLDGAAAGRARLRHGGAYLITGGLGGIGLALAEHLARVAKARLVLVSRSGLPPRDDWDQALAASVNGDAAGRNIRKVRELEALGGEVLVVRADVSRVPDMDSVFREAEARFGEIHGVIHAAGVAGGGVIQLRTREETERVLLAKVTGTLVLDAILKRRQPDFFVLCSSLASVLGGAGQVDYVAANAFLDAVARGNTSGGGPFTVSINWDAWAEVGMAVETAVPRALEEQRRMGLANAIQPREGAEVFERVLGQELPQVVVSTVDLGSRLAAAGAPAASTAAARAIETGKRAHPRPELEGAYVAPRNEVEGVVAEVWQELLGFEALGVQDNFFELGGHSLLATQVVNRLRETFQVPLRLESLFRAPTVAELSAVIVESEAEPGRSGEIARLVRSLAGLSPEQMNALLQDQARPGDLA